MLDDCRQGLLKGLTFNSFNNKRLDFFLCHITMFLFANLKLFFPTCSSTHLHLLIYVAIHIFMSFQMVVLKMRLELDRRTMYRCGNRVIWLQQFKLVNAWLWLQTLDEFIKCGWDFLTVKYILHFKMEMKIGLDLDEERIKLTTNS